MEGKTLNAITISMWRRPEYAKQCLESLMRCEGVNRWRIFVGINPYADSPEITEQLECLSRKILEVSNRPVVTVRKEDVGCNTNVKLLHDDAFLEHDFVLHLDDDVLLAPDALRFCDWAIPFGEDPEFCTVSCWRLNTGWMPGDGIKPEGEDGRISRNVQFMVYAWGCWKNRWPRFRSKWPEAYFPEGPDSYDFHVDQGELRTGFQILPYISRAICIGKDGGLHKDTEIILPYWAGSRDFERPDHYTKTW